MSNKTIRMLISISLNILVIVLGIYIVFIAGTKAYDFGNKIFNEQAVDAPDNARTVEVTIKKDISAKELAKLLYDKGLVEDETITFLQIQFSDSKNKFVAGTYELNTAMKPSDMLKVMAPAKNEEEDNNLTIKPTQSSTEEESESKESEEN